MALSAALSNEEEPLFWPGWSLRVDYPRFVANINDEVTLWADEKLSDFRVYGANSIGWSVVQSHEGFTVLGSGEVGNIDLNYVSDTTREGCEAVYRNREAILVYVAMLVPH